ncbi:MAG: hypothetical protein CL696_01070 [Chloroflexi bacterium]|nr:hypothetical protein [Chloroflexota bacterium]
MEFLSPQGGQVLERRAHDGGIGSAQHRRLDFPMGYLAEIEGQEHLDTAAVRKVAVQVVYGEEANALTLKSPGSVAFHRAAVVLQRETDRLAVIAESGNAGSPSRRFGGRAAAAGSEQDQTDDRQ